jgi:hypothetical protein
LCDQKAVPQGSAVAEELAGEETWFGFAGSDDETWFLFIIFPGIL